MTIFYKTVTFGIIIIFLLSYYIFAEEEREIIGLVLNYRPLPNVEINIATLHRRFLEKFFGEVRYDSCYAKKLDEERFIVAEIFYIGKLKEELMEGESYLIKKKLRQAKDFIIFLWQYKEDSGNIKPANFFTRTALTFSYHFYTK